MTIAARNLLQQETIPTVKASGTSALVDAVARRDLGGLAAAIAAGETAVVPTPECPAGGSAVGLCVSHGWIEGLLVCRDAGLDPNRDAMLRDPLAWAYHLDSPAMVNVLLDMGLDPLALFPDDRLFGIPPERNADNLTEARIAAMEEQGALGAVDRFVLHGLLDRPLPPHLRPRVGCLMLNSPRDRSLDIHRVILARHPNLIGSDAVAPFLAIGIERLVQVIDSFPAAMAERQLDYARSLEALWGFEGLVDATLGIWPRQWSGRPPAPGQIYLWLLPRAPGSQPVLGVWDGAGWGVDGTTVPADQAPTLFAPLATMAEVAQAAYRRLDAAGEDGVDPAPSAALALRVALALGRIKRLHTVSTEGDGE